MKFQQQVANSIASAASMLKNDDLLAPQRELLAKVTNLINKLLAEIDRSKKIVHKAEEEKAPTGKILILLSKKSTSLSICLSVSFFFL